MLCPEVLHFPPPKIITSCKQHDKLESAMNSVQNYFYKTLVVTCPDPPSTLNFLEEIILEDTEYYKISDCSLTKLIEPLFIEKFVKCGKVYCLTAGTNCIVDNCASITPDGILTLHIRECIYQTLGLQGTCQPHTFYEIKIDLLNITQFDKVKLALNKLEKFNFYLSWIPNDEHICPSSIAKYFYDMNVNVSVHFLDLKKLSPEVTEVPNPKDVQLDEMTEWIGMLAVGGDLAPKEPYISSYSQPESDFALHSNKVAVLICTGFIIPPLVENICNAVAKYVSTRDLDNYWASVSIQSQENSLYQWNRSSPRIFQAHNSSCNIFLLQGDRQLIYTVGELKYS